MTLSLFSLLLLLGPGPPTVPPQVWISCNGVTASRTVIQPAQTHHNLVLNCPHSLFLCHFHLFLHSVFFSFFSSCLLLCPLFSPSFALPLRTAKAAVTASPPPCWSLRTTLRSKRTRSASVRERASRFWPPTSRTCTLFTDQPISNHLPQRAGCRDTSWARPQSP